MRLSPFRKIPKNVYDYSVKWYENPFYYFWIRFKDWIYFSERWKPLIWVLWKLNIPDYKPQIFWTDEEWKEAWEELEADIALSSFDYIDWV